MTNEERRFKIKKIESYEKEISKEKRNIIYETFLFGLAAAGASMGFISAHDGNIANLGWGIFNTGISACNLKWLIESICRKTMLQGKIEDMNNELEFSEDEESICIKR